MLKLPLSYSLAMSNSMNFEVLGILFLSLSLSLLICKVSTFFNVYIFVMMLKLYNKESERNKILNTSKFIEFAIARENDKGNFSITENKQFISFLEQTISSFRESYLPIYFVLYYLQFNSSSSRLSLFLFYCVSKK